MSETSPVNTEIANKLFCIYLAPAFKRVYIGSSKTEDEAEDAYKEFTRKFLYILNTSYDKYKKMLEIYESEKNNLMKGVSVTSESKFNDTPQDVQGIYDWSTDDHLTNVTKSTTTADSATVIARIDEIDRLLKDYYEK